MYEVSRTGSVYLENSENRIFYAKPKKMHVNTSISYEFATKTIESLIAALKEHGPLIGHGQLGPANYMQSPQLKGKLCGQKMYKWKPGSVRPATFVSKCIIILGASKTEKHATVYFTCSSDITFNKFNFNRIYKPHLKDDKIYAVSLATFRIYTTYLFFPIPGTIEPNERSEFPQQAIQEAQLDFDSVPEERGRRDSISSIESSLSLSLMRRASIQSNGSTMSLESI